MPRLLAVVHNGAAERVVNSREEAFAFARECKAKTVDLWTPPKPTTEWRWPSAVHPKLYDDGSRPIEFNLSVPDAQSCR
jgi:hypothetical protein